MNILFAVLMMIWGNISGSHPGVTIDQLVKASLITDKPPAEVVANFPKDIPLIPVNKTDPQPNTMKVKGIYTTAYSAGSSRFNTLVKLIDDTDLNAMVVDVKDDNGNITFKPGDPQLDAYGTTTKIMDVSKVISTLKAHNIYPIARIVVFKDNILAKKRPDLSFIKPDGTIWKDSGGNTFLNPYKKEVWDYNIEIAKAAIKAGFKEIQFDYVRFSDTFARDESTLTYSKDDRSKTNIIADFVQYARNQLNPLGVRISVDIFGYTASVPAADGIGQDFNKIAMNVDVISPMIYPSHYSDGWFNTKVPDTQPYITINGAMTDTKKKLALITPIAPIVRPWIQDFTATWLPVHLKYGKTQVDDEIRALKDNGIDEFLLWDAGNVYTPGVSYTQ